MNLTRWPWLLRARPLRAYFAALVALVVLSAVASGLYVQRATSDDARRDARRDAAHSARTAAAQLSDHVELLRSTPAGLAANPQIAQVFSNAEGCTLAYQGFGGPDAGHIDIVDARGRVVCSSRPLDRKATVKGYAASPWLADALRRPVFLAPARDDVVGGPVAIATAPIPGGKGFVAAFADLAALGPQLANLYGGGRETVFLVTTSGDRVVSRSLDSRNWVGRRLEPGALDAKAGSDWVDVDGMQRLYESATVAGTGWTVHVGEERQAVLASVARLRTRQLLLIGLSLLVFLLATALVYRHLAAPIRRLGGAVRETARSGEPTPVEAAGPAEVRALADDVNVLVASVHTELAERRRAEEQAQASEERYRLLFQHNPSPMLVYDPEDLTLLAVNDAALALYGYEAEEVLGAPVDVVLAPQEQPRLRQNVDDLKAGRAHGFANTGIWRHRRRDGSELDVEITADDHLFDGRRARVVLMIDVTERVEAERRLRLSEARYRELFENATDLISVTDLDGRFTDVNAAFVAAVGYGRDELLTMRVADVVAPESQGDVAEARRRKLDDGELKTVYEHELLTRDGRRIQVEAASRIVFDQGAPVGTEAICRDITERKQLEEQLRQAQRLEAIGRLAGGIAHDFNNLLTVIGGYADTLLAERDSTDTEELRQISDASARAAALTRQLLAFSRRQVLQPQVVAVNEVVQGLVPMLTRLIGEDVELVAKLDAGTGTVLADPSQLEQVLLNLAVNARDAMPRGGRLLIETANVELDEEYRAQHGDATTGPHVVLSVTDTGHGMDAETLAHVFEPFFTTKPLGTGTGLGLATVYGIVKQSEGGIWVYSEPGLGTTFKVYLPRHTDPAEPAITRPTPRAVGGSETILLAEDEPALRTLIARMLEQHGYDVVVADSALEAVHIAEDRAGHAFDLLLTDLIMPELSGSELAKRIERVVPGIRVLYMSGYADDVVLRSGSLEPGSPLLEKPFSSTELATKVRALLDAA